VSAAVDPQRRRSRPERAGRWLTIIAIAATVIVPILLGGRDALAATLHFSIQGYIAIFALVVASWFCRTFKLQLLLRRFAVPSRFHSVLCVSLATDFAFMATPGGIGGYAASVYYLRRTGTSTSGATTITALDQGMDVLFFIVALPAAALGLLVADTNWSEAPRTLTTIAFATSALTALAALAVVLGRRKLATWFAALSFDGRWPRVHRVHQAVCAFVATLRADVQRVYAGGARLLLMVFALTALQQFTRYGVLWLVLWLLGHPVGFLLTFLLQVFVLQAAVWTGVPSGAGGAELGLAATLTAWVPTATLATALLLWRIATLYLCLIAGALAIALLARRQKWTAVGLAATSAHPAENVEVPVP
jgi:uncharacterized protein (TIRG00374 family)